MRFLDRTIDLEPFVQGFPYSGFEVDAEHSTLRYFHTTPEGQWLLAQSIPESGGLDLTAGQRVGDVDWSTRSWWGSELHEPSGLLYVWADEANEERMNIWSLDTGSGEMQRVTDNDYTYGWGFSDDGQWLGYVARRGLEEPFDSCLVIRDMVTRAEREVLCDRGGADRFTWTDVMFAPDNGAVLVLVQHDGDRNRGNIARIDLHAESPALELLMPRGVENYQVWPIDRTWDGASFLYVSRESGFDNVYRNSCASGLTEGCSQQLTRFTDEFASASLVESDPPAVLVTLSRPHEIELVAVDAATGATLVREPIDATGGVSDFRGTGGVLNLTSSAWPFRLERLRVSRPAPDSAQLVREPLSAVPSAVAEAIIHCDVERVTYPTFDSEPDGEPRMLTGFLYTPRLPPSDDADRLVRITSFYGGENVFSTSTQIMCAAGIATLSPAPRGSWGFGAEFAALNDGDLGGDEIVDIIEAARWLETTRGYAPWQIGVYGGSHGGYATMRALTFPPETNGRDAHFDFGFGLSHAGFSNILTFFRSCNIPDWVLLEAGDPATEEAKLLDRSPIRHVDLLDAPLLLTHGENDNRVPVEESRSFHARALELGKPVTYVEFAGQGHGIDGLDNTLVYYQAVFGFLDGVVQGNRERPSEPGQTGE